MTLDVLDTPTNSICLQQLPSTPKVKKYLFGAAEGEFDFRLLARHEEKYTALEQLTKICDYFFNVRSIPLMERTTVDIDVTASPTLLEYTDKEWFIYQAQFKLTYKQKGLI